MTTTPRAIEIESPERLELTSEQVGHLRHFANLLNQPINDWSLMQGKGMGQDDFSGFRFQLAYMTYAMALTHKHRLPAAPGVFKPLFERAIAKILHPEVWIYWKDISRGGGVFNGHLADKYHEEFNPVVKDNIMYSAYVQSMALLYSYLFGDNRYAEPGALTFNFWSPFWGVGEAKRFEYDQNSLNSHVYWLMVESGYLGVACEPNCVYQICNQPAILGFRMHDLLTGGGVADEVTSGYQQAWERFGVLDEGKHYNVFVLEDTKTAVPNDGAWPWADAWCGSLMNMWNHDFVHENYVTQVKDLLVPGPDGTFSVDNPTLPIEVEVDTCDFGWVAVWASEMGDQETLAGLLSHADRFMKPKWRDGGLYYPRNDAEKNADGVNTMMDPMGGNVLLGYSRLNVPDGMCRLYNEVWDRKRFGEPMLSSVASNVDVSRAYFDADTRELLFSVKANDEFEGDSVVALSNLDSTGSRWTMYEDGREVAVCRDGVLDATGVALRRVADAYELTCTDGDVRRFVIKY